MTTARYIHWQDGDMWLGYFEEFPDHIMQGESQPNFRKIFGISLQN